MQLDTVRQCTLFLSSGADAKALRNYVHTLVDDAINPALDNAGVKVVLRVRRWEQVAPGQAIGESVNDQFVRLATQSSVMLCLLTSRLGPGTRAEIEGGLAADGVEVSIFWFVNDDEWPDSDVGRYLRRHRDDLLFQRPGYPRSADARMALTKFLFEVAVRLASTPPSGSRRERR